MKKFILAAIMVLFAANAFAAGSVTTTGPTFLESQIYTITYAWTGDASNGTVPATAGPEIEGFVLMAVTDPGSTAPTDNYDITLTDGDSVDVFGAELSNRDTLLSEQAIPKVGSDYKKRYVKGTLTLNLSNNSATSATGTVKVYVYSIRER